MSVLSDNATIKQASRLQHAGVFINSFFFCSLFGGTGTRRVRALRSSKNASIFEPTERRKYLLIRQINWLLPRWVVRVSKTEWWWLLVFELRPFIKESNILTKCTVESITGRFFIWFRVENSNVNCFIKERLSWISVSEEDCCGVVSKSLPFRSHTYT